MQHYIYSRNLVALYERREKKQRRSGVDRWYITAIMSSTHPLFCWLLKSKHSVIRREHHSLTPHRNIHPTPLISFQTPVAYAIYWAVSELLSNFSSWFSKPVSKKGKNLIQCLSIDWVLFLSPFWMWTGRKYLPSHGQRTEWQKYSTLSLWVWKGSRYSQSFPLSDIYIEYILGELLMLCHRYAP